MKLMCSFAVFLLFAGCTVTDRDVSEDAHFLVGYKPGEVYRLKQPAKLLEHMSESGGSLIPVAEEPKYDRVVRVVEPGTLIKINSLQHWVAAAPFQWGTTVEVDAEFVEEPGYKVFLQSISGVEWIDGDWRMKTPVLCPDPQWMELQSAGSEGIARSRGN